MYLYKDIYQKVAILLCDMDTGNPKDNLDDYDEIIFQVKETEIGPALITLRLTEGDIEIDTPAEGNITLTFASTVFADVTIGANGSWKWIGCIGIRELDDEPEAFESSEGGKFIEKVFIKPKPVVGEES